MAAGSSRFQKLFNLDVSDFQIKLWCSYFGLFWIRNYFGYFFQILGNFFNHLVTLKKRRLAIVWKKWYIFFELSNFFFQMAAVGLFTLPRRPPNGSTPRGWWSGPSRLSRFQICQPQIDLYFKIIFKKSIFKIITLGILTLTTKTPSIKTLRIKAFSIKILDIMFVFENTSERNHSKWNHYCPMKSN